MVMDMYVCVFDAFFSRISFKFAYAYFHKSRYIIDKWNLS